MAEILKMNLADAKANLNQMSELKSKLVTENSKVFLNNSDCSILCGD